MGGLLVKDNSYISNLHNTSAFKSQGSIGATVNIGDDGIASPTWFRIISDSAANNSAIISLQTSYTVVRPRCICFWLSGGSSQDWKLQKIHKDDTTYFQKIRIVSLVSNKYAVDILMDWGDDIGIMRGVFANNFGFIFSQDKIPVVPSDLPTGETLVQEFDLLSL
ncbi:hypothetical protein [uncultured Bacteroides sp.]|uniref:hypothetical protein n=1 Tax=uncultured Bacteroides sp. TaxID=162156 RepID=UPI0026076E5D|nr:hypothetical protein [uncultured Bacteroides sp.]